MTQRPLPTPDMRANVLQTVLNAMSNASREPVEEQDVISILTTGDGPGHLVRALFGDCSIETLDRIAAEAGRTPPQLRAAYRIASEKHGAVNAEIDAA